MTPVLPPPPEVWTIPHTFREERTAGALGFGSQNAYLQLPGTTADPAFPASPQGFLSPRRAFTAQRVTPGGLWLLFPFFFNLVNCDQRRR